MQPLDMFLKGLDVILSGEPRGAQARLAKHLGIDRPRMNDYIKGRKTFPDEMREQTAAFFGYRYEDILAIGRAELNHDELPTIVPTDILEAARDPDLHEVIRAAVRLKRQGRAGDGA